MQKLIDDLSRASSPTEMGLTGEISYFFCPLVFLQMTLFLCHSASADWETACPLPLLGC